MERSKMWPAAVPPDSRFTSPSRYPLMIFERRSKNYWCTKSEVDFCFPNFARKEQAWLTNPPTPHRSHQPTVPGPLVSLENGQTLPPELFFVLRRQRVQSALLPVHLRPLQAIIREHVPEVHNHPSGA